MDKQLVYLIVFSALVTLLLILSFLFLVYVVFFRNNILTADETEAECIPDQLRVDHIKYDSPELYKGLSSLEKLRFSMARKFYEFYHPVLNYVSFLSYDEVDAAYLMIRDRGIRSFYFESYTDQIHDLEAKIHDEREQAQAIAADETMPLVGKADSPNYFATSDDYKPVRFSVVPYTVHELTDIAFTTSAMSSAVMNMAIPYKNRKNDTVYFETKLYEFDPDTTTIAVGLVTKPYPNFQLPGMSPYSIAIQSNGTVRMNNHPYVNDDDLPVVLPQFIEGDIVGIGYRSINGAIFITHNGKNVLEIIRRFKTELYPCIGSVGGPCKVAVNLGQLGFVFIEANVKKLGFCESKNEGTIGAPPSYSTTLVSKDPLLDKGEELPPGYPEDEQTFFGPKSLLKGKSMLKQALEGRKTSDPPSYRSKESDELKEKSIEKPREGNSNDAAKVMDSSEYEQMVTTKTLKNSVQNIMKNVKKDVDAKVNEVVKDTKDGAIGDNLKATVSSAMERITEGVASKTTKPTVDTDKTTKKSTTTPNIEVNDTAIRDKSPASSSSESRANSSSSAPTSHNSSSSKHRRNRRRRKHRRRKGSRTTF